MKGLTLKEIARICGGTLHNCRADLGNQEVSTITTDSRKVEQGALFVAIPGARVDGHSFIPQVMEQGALAALTERELPEAEYPYIQIRSSLQAVKEIAEFYLQQLHIPVVGITGSVGKTSTKEMIAAILSQRYRTLKTEGNFNNELGLPLTVFRLRDEDEIAVLEMGISDFGEMHRLAKIARPDTAVLTNIGWCHLENLKDRDGILKAKTEIFDFLKDDGHIVLNGDDDKLATVGEIRGIRPIRFGLDANNNYYADQIEPLGFRGIRCMLHTPEGAVQVQIPMPGSHMVYNALAGAAVGQIYGLTLEEIRAGIESLQPVAGRFHIIETENYTVIDDCYNANPVSMKASLNVLKDGPGRRVAVLGDMGELGVEENELHAQVGVCAGESGIDALYCAGPLSQAMADAARETNPEMEIRHFADRNTLMEKLPELLQNEDTVLVKASHFMEFGKIVEWLEQNGGEKQQSSEGNS